MGAQVRHAVIWAARNAGAGSAVAILWRLRRTNPRPPIPVITGMPDALSHPALIREPPGRLFSKPLDVAALVAWLKAATS